MRSRSNSTEGSTGIRGSSRHRERSQARNGQREGTGSAHAGRSKERHRDTGTVRKNHAHGRRDGLQERDLSRDDLLLLLSVLEGELQARDEVIKVLEAERVERAQLQARYGCEGPLRALQTLRSDALHARALQGCEDIYEKPMSELDRLVQTQRQTHRRMLEQLLLVEQAHRQTLHRLEEEQRINCQLRHRSATFSSLQERERERLKLLIDRERANQEKKEEESNRKVSSLKEELIQLKSFTLLLVDEQQRLTDQLALQTAKPQERSSTTAGAEETPSSGQTSFEEEKGEAFQSEETHEQANHNFRQEQEGMTAKLTNEDIQNRQLRQKLTTLSRQLDELEETSKILRRAEEELQDLRDKMSRGECGNSSLISEAERLRKRVLEMAGKDEELIKMEDQCRNLNNKLQKEAGQARGLRAEVDKLNRRIAELEKLEDAFSKSKQECCTLKCNLEKEKSMAKHLNSELDALKVRIKELEAIEGKLEGKETTLKEDLAKLKALTVMLVDERKTMTERLRDTESKLQCKSGKFQAEQDKVTSATEKLIEENKKALNSKAELEERMCGATKERDELRARLKAEEEKSRDLQSKVSMMKKRLQSLETVEREFLKNKAREEQGRLPTANRFQQEDNKVKELTQELEKLRRKLKEKKVVENDLLKTEDDFESLEKKYSNEQKRAKALMDELEISRKELSKYQLAEKEVSNQENILYKRLKDEEARSSHLTREVEALKEKVHGYMGTEDSICRMKRDHAALQRRLTQQEVRNKELAREMENLTSELERYRRFSKSLRPGMNGRRFSDMNTSCKEVQTEPVDGQPPDYRSLAPLHQVSMNGREYEEVYPEVNLSPTEKMPQANISSPILNSMTNNVRRSKVPFPRGKEGSHPINGTVLPLRHSGGQTQQGDMVLTHTPGQPLHIKVTPDHGHNVAMLEITSPGPVDNPHSYTSTAVIPTSSVTPPKQRITIIQNASVSPQFKAKGPSSPLDGLCVPDRAMSPLSMATYSRAMTPESAGSISPDRALSPIQIVSVTTGAPGGPLTTEPVEVVGGHTVFRVIPERQSQWQLQRSNSSSPSIITTEDNKIHIHLGNPYIQALNSPAGPLSTCHTIAQEHRTPVLTNGTLSKGANKITSSITITPATSPIPRPSQMTVSNVYD